MLKAQQSAVVQQANVNLVGIRSNEVAYFAQFYTNFGTQCCIICGFAICSISQTPGPTNPQETCTIACDTQFFQIMYWISTAMVCASGIFVCMSTVYCSVYGQGMALRGPPGSMVKAVEGMIQEQVSVVYAFGVTAFFIVPTIVGIYFINMTLDSAILCTLITVGGMFYWYTSALRIYNRFKLEKNPTSGFDDNDDDDDGLGDSSRRERSDALKRNLVTEKKKSKPKSFLSRFSSTKQAHSFDIDFGDAGDATDASSPFHDDADESSFEGYLSMEIQSLTGKKWIRRFFVLKNAHAVYYKDKTDYTRGKGAITKRPIALAEFAITTSVTDDAFMIVLSPNGDVSAKNFRFRCDTLTELQGWAEAFQRAVSSYRPPEPTEARSGATSVASARPPTVSSASMISSATRR